jgi:sRNA-binding carbon storage regulator CsrA
MNNHLPKPDGSGLILTRRAGERIYVMAKDDASDAEIIAAVREGMIISLLHVSTGMERDPEMPRGTAKLRFQASEHLYIAREELLRDYKEIDQAYG